MIGLILLTSILGFAESPTTSSTEFQLKVMSFNVRYGSANDGENAWDKRKNIVTETIKMHGPDVIGTQECLDFQADYIVESLLEYRWLGIGREKDGHGEHMAVLYKSKLLSPIAISNFWLSDTPDVAGSKAWGATIPRMVTQVLFRHIESDRYFYFVNTHFDHRSEEARVNSAKLLSTRLSSLSEEYPAILTGDFNSAAERAEAWTVLTQSGMTDTWLTAENKLGPTGTFGGFESPDEDGFRIDWILTRGAIRATICQSVTHNVDGRYPSDHLPVFAELFVGP